jgi:mannose PTS system EIIA component
VRATTPVNNRVLYRAMPHILIVAHAPLASALASVAAHAYAECAQHVLVFDVGDGDAPEQVEQRMRQAMHAANAAEALILTDVVGATPHMGAMRVAEGNTLVRMVSGVNVPMLWRTLCYRHEPLDQLVARATDGGRLGVMHMSSTRPANQTPSSSASIGQGTRTHAQDTHHDQQ